MPQNKTIVRCVGLAATAVLCCYATPSSFWGRGGRVEAAAPPSTAADSKNVLERDPRLQQKVTLERSRANAASVLRTLTHDSGVKLSADTKVGTFPLLTALRDVPLKDAMDAIAALYNAAWNKTEQKSYVLRDVVPQLNGLLPQNQAERAQFRAGLDFAAEAQKMTPATRRKLAEAENHYGIPFNDLPASMQRSTRRVLEAQLQREELEGPTFPATKPGGKPLPLPVQPSTLPASTVMFDGDTKAGLTFYTISIAMPERGNVMVTFNNYEQLRAEQQARLANAQTYSARSEPAAGPREVAQDARLSQPVSLTLGKTILPRAVSVLAGKVRGVDFVALGRDQVFPDEVRSVALPTMPLRDLLDRLTALYPHREWELRKSGVVVVKYK